ncbi:RibD family protein [Microcoleus sp. FACHB-1515]|uniref:RibD family protein n=1 Tax=Cyanophyceae TaxID=3028117 RepID=UPI0016857F33|nr:RibD family protein [Microcoleus sp. FACHB-1515]MBD2088649.1 RibD family protein [Microcoleus sp. FACHB-1515]
MQRVFSIYTVVVLAMSADGKIADANRSPARFGSVTDKAHLEAQVAQADAVLFGAETLRAYETTLRVTHPDLLKLRQQNHQPPQPIQIVASRSAKLNSDWRFFSQPVPRWLLTTPAAQAWDAPHFDRVLTIGTPSGIDWRAAWKEFAHSGIRRIAVLGGGSIVWNLLELDLIDELRLTICPLLLGGTIAPTPAAGIGFPEAIAPRLQLLSAEAIDHEVFLHYRLQHREV